MLMNEGSELASVSRRAYSQTRLKLPVSRSILWTEVPLFRTPSKTPIPLRNAMTPNVPRRLPLVSVLKNSNPALIPATCARGVSLFTVERRVFKL
jgi:hypothetical protein